MHKTFSTKLDTKILSLLDKFCRRYHIKKGPLLEELILEGIRRRAEFFSLVQSLRRGLEDEEAGRLYSSEEVEQSLFGRRRGD